MSRKGLGTASDKSISSTDPLGRMLHRGTSRPSRIKGQKFCKRSREISSSKFQPMHLTSKGNDLRLKGNRVTNLLTFQKHMNDKKTTYMLSNIQESQVYL